MKLFILALALATVSGFPACTCSNNSKLLLTSSGGVGSSHAFSFLKETNSWLDLDEYKHKFATYWDEQRCTRNGVVMLNSSGGFCFDEVVVAGVQESLLRT